MSLSPNRDSARGSAGENQARIALEDELLAKVVSIEAAVKLSDIDGLVNLATSNGGFLNDELRCKAWPILLGSNIECEEADGTEDQPGRWKELPCHRDEDQVHLDVNRAFVYYPSESEKEIENRKSMLSDLIIQVLREHPLLCYFQGYHDIIQVFLLVLGPKLAPPAVRRISLFRIRDYMLPSLAPSLRHLHIIPALLELADVDLGQHLSHTRPFFALAATLTLYAHDIQEYSDIARLYDFLLAHEPVVAIYMFTAIIISRRHELLEISVDDPEMLHFALSKLPQPLDLELLINRTVQLFSSYPPDRLPRLIWWRLSPNSVLKTARDLKNRQSLKQGEIYFSQQARQLRREELQQKALQYVWKHRRPASSISLAIVVGIMSFWFSRNGYDRFIWGSMQKFVGAVLGRR